MHYVGINRAKTSDSFGNIFLVCKNNMDIIFAVKFLVVKFVEKSFYFTKVMFWIQRNKVNFRIAFFFKFNNGYTFVVVSFRKRILKRGSAITDTV